MKKTLCILSVLCILLVLPSCSTRHKDDLSSAVFYYCRQTLSYNEADDVICAEVRPQVEIGSDLQGILAAYLSGPISQNLINLFPEHTTADTTQGDNTVSIQFSENCTQLSDLDFVLACSCLAKTLFPLSEAQILQFSIENSSSDLVAFHRNSVLTDENIQIIG